MNDEPLAQHIDSSYTREKYATDTQLRDLAQTVASHDSELLGLRAEYAATRDLARHTWHRVWIAAALAGLAFGTAIGAATIGIIQ